MKTLKSKLLHIAGSSFLFINCLFFADAFANNDPHRLTNRSTNNLCDVEADFTPGVDSILTSANRQIRFENASVNATSYKFIIDRWSAYPLNTPVNYTFDAGVHSVQLVAYNGTCTDTITRHYFYPGIPTTNRNNFKADYGVPGVTQYTSDLKALADGGYVIGGYFGDNSWNKYPNQAFITKLNESGAVEWSRSIKPNVYTDGRIFMITPAADGGMIVNGVYSYSTANSYLMKVDKDGKLVWKKIYSGPGYGFYARAIHETDDGGMIAVGAIYDQPGLAVVRLDGTGNVVWSKLFSREDWYVDRLVNILQKGNTIYIGGTGFIQKMDYATGMVTWTKFYHSTTGYFEGKDMSWLGNKILVNGNTASVHGGSIVNAFFIMDTDGKIDQAYQTYAVYTSTNQYSRMHPAKDGSFYIVNSGIVPYTPLPGLQGRIIRHSVFIRLKADFSVDWSRQYGESQYLFSALGKNDNLAALGEEIGKGVYAWDFSHKQMFKKMDATGSEYCQSSKDSAYTLAIAMRDSLVTSWAETIDIPLTQQDPDMAFGDLYPQARFVCPTEFVDSCSFAVVDGPKTFCDINTVYTYKLKKNKGCHQPIQWRVSAPATIVSNNENEIKIRFNSLLEKFTVAAVLTSSNNAMIDSMIVTAAPPRTIPLNLGNDTTICANTTIVLRASRYYLSYQWQDGSSNQKFVVTKPGTYWVKVTDPCGNELRDTIIISPRPGIEVNAGPDLEKCNNDTIHIKAPSGYLSYNWSPGYNISSTSGATIIVNPGVDTAYILKAEKIPGCFAYDTIRVRVNHSPAIDLGRDTSFCSGEYLLLNAGPGFSTYLWSNGETTQQIVAASHGRYAVTATTMSGCKSFDTLEIVNIWEKPVVKLTGDNTFCAGESKILSAGNFSSFLWQDGSTLPEFVVSDAGTYHVTVWDNNQCTGSDTLHVLQLLPAPANFLPADTLLCSIENFELSSLKTFRSYSWNNGSTGASITISTPGIYWLQVNDNNNCRGRDSIIVDLKDCITGFHIPTAFTPNGDGLNDLFRPVIAGNPLKYQFVVYDRQGQPIFKSNEPGKGWDGLAGGKIAVGNTFLWTCTYQLNGQPPATEKGSVILIK